MRYTIFFIFCITYYSCAPEMYIPNMQNIPSFKQKGEVKGNISISDLGFDAQCAYSISNSTGVLLNVVHKSSNSNDDYYENPGNGFGLELGAGYYKKRKNFIGEVYGFIGIGKLYNGPISFNTNDILEAKLCRIAVQPSITYSRKNIELILSTRFSNVNYFNISKEPYVFNNVDLSSKLREKSNYSFLEPSFTLRLGLKNVKIQFQTQKVYLLNKVSEFDYYYWNDVSALGLFFKI